MFSGSEQEDAGDELEYQPALDMKRFQKFLEKEQKKASTEEPGGSISQSVAAKAMEQILRMAVQSANGQGSQGLFTMAHCRVRS